MYEQNYFNEDTQTKFNASVASLIRLDRLLTDCNNFSRTAILDKSPYYLNLWRATLMGVYQEVMPNCTDKEYNKTDPEIKKIFADVKKIRGLMIKKKSETETDTSYVNPKIFAQVFNLLHKVEFELRKIATRKGMLLIKGGEEKWWAIQK